MLSTAFAFLLVIAKFLFRSHSVINTVFSHKRSGSKAIFWIGDIPVFPLWSFLDTASRKYFLVSSSSGCLSYMYPSMSLIFSICYHLSAVFLSSIYTAFPLFLFPFSSQLFPLPFFENFHQNILEKKEIPVSV